MVTERNSEEVSWKCWQSSWNSGCWEHKDLKKSEELTGENCLSEKKPKKPSEWSWGSNATMKGWIAFSKNETFATTGFGFKLEKRSWFPLREMQGNENGMNDSFCNLREYWGVFLSEETKFKWNKNIHT